MLRMLLSGSLSLNGVIAYVLSALAIVFLVLPLHESAHAFAADKLGDPTARYQHRLTLNPMAHVDWLGALMILLFGFGWANPVPVNMRNFRNPKRDMALTALAGPASNLLAALVAGLAFGAVNRLYINLYFTSSGLLIWLVELLAYFFLFLLRINVSLAVFNIIPIPPLDGSRLLSALLPDRIYYQLMRYERFFFILILLICFSSSFSSILSGITGAIENGILSLANLIF